MSKFLKIDNGSMGQLLESSRDFRDPAVWGRSALRELSTDGNSSRRVNAHGGTVSTHRYLVEALQYMEVPQYLGTYKCEQMPE